MVCLKCPPKDYSGQLWLPPEKRRDGTIFSYDWPICKNCETEMVPARP